MARKTNIIPVLIKHGNKSKFNTQLSKISEVELDMIILNLKKIIIIKQPGHFLAFW